MIFDIVFYVQFIKMDNKIILDKLLIFIYKKISN